MAECLVRTVLSGGSIPQSHAGQGYPGHQAAYSQHAGGFGAAGYGGGYGGVAAAAFGSVDTQMAETAVAAGQIVSTLASHLDLPSNTCRTSVKIYIPEKSKLGCSRGKILGQRGTTLKQLQAESGCKLSIRGRVMSPSPRATAHPLVPLPRTFHMRHLVRAK